MDTLLNVATFTANQGFSVSPFLSASKTFRDDELLWDAAKDFQGTGGYTRLMWAAMKGHIGRVRWLIERGAKVNMQTENGQSALYYACENGHTGIVKMLIAAGANVNEPKSMYIAMFMGHTEIVKELIDAGANVNATDWDNHTLLMQASESGDHAIMRLLIAAGADVNAKNSYGRTPLSYAADGCAETARILLEAGACVEGIDLSN